MNSNLYNREYQRLEYTPYGEIWIEKTNNSGNKFLPYKFTGKEMDEARRNNANLPGRGGVFNHINGNLYHYAGNNPVRYIDPDGKKIVYSLFNSKSDIKKIKEALNKIRQSSDGAELLDKLEESPNVIKIYAVSGKATNETVVDEKGKKDGSGSKVYWNTESRNGGVDDEGKSDTVFF